MLEQRPRRDGAEEAQLICYNNNTRARGRNDLVTVAGAAESIVERPGPARGVAVVVMAIAAVRATPRGGVVAAPARRVAGGGARGEHRGLTVDAEEVGLAHAGVPRAAGRAPTAVEAGGGRANVADATAVLARARRINVRAAVAGGAGAVAGAGAHHAGAADAGQAGGARHLDAHLGEAGDAAGAFEAAGVGLLGRAARRVRGEAGGAGRAAAGAAGRRERVDRVGWVGRADRIDGVHRAAGRAPAVHAGEAGGAHAGVLGGGRLADTAVQARGGRAGVGIRGGRGVANGVAAALGGALAEAGHHGAGHLAARRGAGAGVASVEPGGAAGRRWAGRLSGSRGDQSGNGEELHHPEVVLLLVVRRYLSMKNSVAW